MTTQTDMSQQHQIFSKTGAMLILFGYHGEVLASGWTELGTLGI